MEENFLPKPLVKLRIEGKINQEEIDFFGKFLQESRNKIGKTQKDVSLEINVNVTTLGKWEKGETFPREEILESIANAYGVDLEALTEAFSISKVAHEVEKNARKPRKVNRPSFY